MVRLPGPAGALSYLLICHIVHAGSIYFWLVVSCTNTSDASLSESSVGSTLASLNVVNMALVIASVRTQQAVYVNIVYWNSDLLKTAIQGGSAIGPAASYVTLFIDP